jgi:hypothetical protein
LAPLARVNLGALLLSEDPGQAQELLEAALSAPDRQVVWLAQAGLGGLLMVHDPVRGRELLEAALASGDPRVVPLAQANLGPLLQAQDPVRARALLTAALSSGDGRVVPLAQANLAGLGILGRARVRVLREIEVVEIFAKRGEDAAMVEILLRDLEAEHFGIEALRNRLIGYPQVDVAEFRDCNGHGRRLPSRLNRPTTCQFWVIIPGDLHLLGRVAWPGRGRLCRSGGAGPALPVASLRRRARWPV